MQLAKQCQARLEDPRFDLVPLNVLHLTVRRVGFLDQVVTEVAATAADAARKRCLRLSPFKVEIGPLAGSRGARSFSVSPWSALFPMHQALADAVRDVVGDQSHMDTRSFRPHLSIAYANTDVAVRPLLPVIDELRALPAVSATVSEVALVKLRREGTVYRFDTLFSVPLGPVPMPA
ncbi:2'-5' RNA ligase family protein [Actinosynnema sp. NPDC023587]|uniref:2'-5' RNA ligase family protein n=1 Tax=Actinosynnema sp. NPDC023587 TaxID=3154695 RepID=UPI0033CB59A6